MEQGIQALQEKIFNLQLTIQKQDEELRLYRNGTTANELFELIHEKEIEIELWRVKCEEKDEKLKRLAKTSGDVLMKYEELQSNLQSLYDLKSSLEQEVKIAQEKKKEQELVYQEQKKEMNKVQDELHQRENEIGSLRLQLWEMEQKLEEIQNTTNHAQLATMEATTEVKQLRDYQQELEHLIAEQTQEITSLTQEVKKWKSYVNDQDQSIEKLQKRCAALVSEKAETLRSLDLERQEMISHVQNFRETMTVNLSQRDEALKRREEKIRELQFQISVLQQELKMKTGQTLPLPSISSKDAVTNKDGKKVLSERVNNQNTNSVQGSSAGLVQKTEKAIVKKDHHSETASGPAVEVEPIA